MKRSTLKVGSENTRQAKDAQGARITIDHYVCGYNEPETVSDCLALSGGDESQVVKMFKRGYTIKLQDGCGRPMWDAGESQEAIQLALDNFKLGVTKAIGRPPKPTTVEVPKQKSYTPDEVAALLAKAKVTAKFE